MRADFTVRFNQPPEIVWPYISQPERWAEWVPAVLERTRIGDGPVGPGSKWRAVDRVGPMKVDFIDELAEMEPNRRVVWHHSEPWNATSEDILEADGDGSVLRVLFEGKLSGKLRWLDWIPDSMATRVYRSDMERLGRMLDAREAEEN